MKFNKKIIATIIAGIMVLSVGCSPKKEEQASVGEAAGGTLIMATNAAFPPYEFYEGGKIVGIDVEIAEKIAEKLGMTLQIEDMEFGSIITAVVSGKADIGLAGMTVDEDRLQSVNFSESYATGYQVIIVNEGSTIKVADDLADKSVGVQESTTGDIYVSDDYKDADVQRYSKGTDAVQALLQGKVDAVVIDREPAKVFIEQNPTLSILPTEYVVEEYAIVMAKEDTQLLEKVNAALKELIEDGTVQTILDKYIVAE